MATWTDKYTGNEGATGAGINTYVNRKSEIVVGFSALTCDFVCDGDGVADDAAVIQNAIDYAGDHGYQAVVLRTGIYYQKSIINNDVNSLIVRGEGWSVYESAYRIKCIASLACQAKISAIVPGGFENLRFDGNLMATDVIRIGEPSNKIKGVTLNNIVCENVTGYGITVNNSVASGAWDDSTFYNVYILDCDKGFRNFSTRTTFIGGSISGCATQALEIPQYSGGTFIGTVFSTNEIDIHYNGTDACLSYLFKGCYFEDCTTALFKRTGSAIFLQGGFSFENCILFNHVSTSSPFIDTTNLYGAVFLDGCHLPLASGGLGSKVIKVDANVNFYYRGTTFMYNSGFEEQLPSFTGTGQVHVMNKRSFYSVAGGSYSPSQALSGSTIIVNTNNLNVNLPSAIAGLEFFFFAGDTHTITLTPAAGDNIDLGGAYVISAGSGKEAIHIKALDDSNWAIMSKVGTWTTH